MANLGPTQSTQFLDIPIFNSQFPKEGAKAVPTSLDFSLQQSYALDFTLLQSRGYMRTWQSVWVDNSLNASVLSIQVAGSNQVLKIPGSSQGTYPIFVPGAAQFTVNCAGGQRASIVFMNVPSFTATWGVSGAFSFTANGYLQTSDVALDAIISGGSLPVLQQGTGNNNVVKPVFVADELFTGSATAIAAQTIITGAPSFFITEVEVYVSGDAALAAAGEFTVQLKDGATVIAEGVAMLPAAAGTNFQSAQLISLKNIQYNSKGNAQALTLTGSAALTAGKYYWNIAGGLCSNIGP